MSANARTQRIAQAIAPHLYAPDVRDRPGYQDARADVESTVGAVLNQVDQERGDRDLTVDLIAAALEDGGHTAAADRVRELTLRTTDGLAQHDPPTGTLKAVPAPVLHRRDVDSSHLLRGNRR